LTTPWRNWRGEMTNLNRQIYPGAGPPGGLGSPWPLSIGASLKSGVEIVMNAVSLRDRLAGADLCLTGEGRLDGQSLKGKTVAGVAGTCRKLGVPCAVLAGSVDGSIDYRSAGITTARPIDGNTTSREQSIKNAVELISAAAEKLLVEAGPVN